MAARIYIDANVYLDYFEDRTDGIRPLGEFAFQVFKRALRCEFEIVISNKIMNEIDNHCRTAARLNALFEELLKKQKLIRINATIEEKNKAKEHEAHNDLLHYLLAERTGCKFIVTRNIQHFSDFPGFVKAVLPEEI